MAMQTAPQTKHRLEVKRNLLPYTMIDDAYNSNPAGFAAALDVLDLLGSCSGGRRILITPGMVELGALHDSEHMRMGLLAAKKADWIIAVAPQRMPTFGLAVREAIKSVKDLPPITAPDGGIEERATVMYDEVPTLEAARAKIENLLGRQDVVLFENDLPDLYESKLKF
jgi:UDP-N-acetylmuramoyl-tripeptide--D-alanyl-D-alanine ligase